jgi:hypothetical protein
MILNGFKSECDKLAAEGLLAAINDAGNRNRLATLVGLKLPSVTDWRAVPLIHVRKLCQAFGRPPQRYRPDVFAAPRLLRELAK